MLSRSLWRFAVFALLFVPAVAAAQATHHRTHTATSTMAQYDYPGTTPAQQQAISQWQHASDIQQQAAALGTTPVASLPMPALFGVAPSDLTPNFGDPRTNHPHEGEDILAVKGTPIVSPTAAVVLRLEQGANEGNGIYTLNPGGETFVYYHLDRYAEGIVAGQLLAPGALLGYVGDTGDAAGGPAHIHFEIHNSSGTPTDPFPRLTGEFSLEQKIAYLAKILTQTTDPVALARFLVTNFRSDFLDALAANITLPVPIVDALGSIPAAPAAVGSGPLPAGDLDVGSTGPLVITLQQYLIQAASGAAAVRLKEAGATGTFGPLTQAALAEYQLHAGIAPALGYYGAVTRAFIAAHPLTSDAATATPAAPSAPRDLSLGTTGEDVRALQALLNSKGFIVATTGPGSVGQESVYFGPATQAAVIAFQKAQSIAPALGYVGPLTRTALAAP